MKKNASIIKDIVKRKTTKFLVIRVSNVEDMVIMQIIVGLINLHIQNHHLQKDVIYAENMVIMK
jgi:hypothetical protein